MDEIEDVKNMKRPIAPVFIHRKQERSLTYLVHPSHPFGDYRSNGGVEERAKWLCTDF